MEFIWIRLMLLTGFWLSRVQAQCYEGNCLYPYGPDNGDQRATGDDGPPIIINLDDVSAFRFYGQDYTKIYVSFNGLVSFANDNDGEEDRALVDCFPSTVARHDPPFLASFWNDIFLTGNPGVLYYRLSTDTQLLKKLSIDIAFKGKQFKPTAALIFTWINATSYDDIHEMHINTSYIPRRNTFQTALILNNKGESYAIFNYFIIQWYLAHSLPAVALLNRGRHSSHVTNLFASGSELMLNLADVCANAGVYGRFVIRTYTRRVQILDQPVPAVIERCYNKHSSLYPYGASVGDNVLETGDEGPPGELTFSKPATYYGARHKKVYININGPISFDSEYLQQWPKRIPVDEVTFMAAFWNDIFLRPDDEGKIYYRLESNPEVLRRFRRDVHQIGRLINPTELLIVTWSLVKAYAATDDDPVNTFQVVFGYEANKSYTLFIYSHIGWYQDISGHYAVAVFNKGASSGVNLDVSPKSGPEYFIINKRGNSVDNPGMFIFETHPPIITEERPTCVCRLNKRKWVITYDGKRHPILHEQKTRISRYLEHDDPCKFQLSVYTTRVDSGDFIIKWVSFAFGVHEKNHTKFDKDIQIERFKKDTVVLRGRELKGPRVIQTPWQWTSSDEKTQVFLVGDNKGGWVLNSTFCPYRLEYAPNCPDPVVILTIQKGYYHSGSLVGMCQDCNGDPNNDYRPCSDDPVNDWTFWSKIPDVSKTCEDTG